MARGQPQPQPLGGHILARGRTQPQPATARGTHVGPPAGATASATVTAQGTHMLEGVCQTLAKTVFYFAGLRTLVGPTLRRGARGVTTVIPQPCIGRRHLFSQTPVGLKALNRKLQGQSFSSIARTANRQNRRSVNRQYRRLPWRTVAPSIVSTVALLFD